MNVHIPYRTRRLLGRVGFILLIILAVALLLWGCWMLWLQRYVVYTRDQGAKLDFELSPELAKGQIVEKPQQPQVNIYYNEGEDAINTSKDLQKLQGYYITYDDLLQVDQVKAQLEELPAGTAVMVQVKSINGSFYYSSSVAERRSQSLDIAKVDELLQWLEKSDLYTIAYVPALRDYYYGLHHVPDGLPTSGGYLWMDDESCYWLNPASQGTLSYIVQIINELKGMGFDEVTLFDFRFPDTSSIVFKSDKTEALTAAAKTLVTTCATENFAVSFVCENSFTMPEGRSRMFMKNVAPAQVAQVAENSGLENAETHLVFMTDLHDTRFEAYGILRPISMAE